MARKTIKLEDLRSMTEDGADVVRHPREVKVIGLDEVSKQIKASNKDHNKAILSAIDKLTDVLSEDKQIDLAPLIEAINSRKYPSYGITIKRDSERQMKYLLMVPIF